MRGGADLDIGATSVDADARPRPSARWPVLVATALVVVAFGVIPWVTTVPVVDVYCPGQRGIQGSPASCPPSEERTTDQAQGSQAVRCVAMFVPLRASIPGMGYRFLVGIGGYVRSESTVATACVSGGLLRLGILAGTVTLAATALRSSRPRRRTVARAGVLMAGFLVLVGLAPMTLHGMRSIPLGRQGNKTYTFASDPVCPGLLLEARDSCVSEPKRTDLVRYLTGSIIATLAVTGAGVLLIGRRRPAGGDDEDGDGDEGDVVAPTAEVRR